MANQNCIIGIVGAGAMGTGIAQVLASAGHPVMLFDSADGVAENSKQRIADVLKRLVEKERISEQDRTTFLNNITPCTQISDLAPARLIMEAALEQLDVKHEVFTRLEDICSKDTILATNTSSLSVTEIGSCLNDPGRFIGLHFFNPAPLMALVEVVPGLNTAPHVIDTVKHQVKSWGKIPVLAKSTPGFIVNRVARPYYGETFRLLEEGVVDPATLDAAMCESGGFRMGPCELMDLIGLDIGLAVTRSVWQACHGDSRYAPSFLQEEMVDGNRLGRKTKRGFYDYKEDSERALPVDAATGNKPDKVTIHGEWRPAKSLLILLQNTDIEVSYKPGHSDYEFMIELENCVITVTDGRPAYEIAAKVFSDFQKKDVIIFDLAYDYTITKRIIMAAPDGCSMSSLNEAVGFFQTLGKQVSIIDDSPGLIVGRIVCMLINEAADVVHRGISSVEDVDIAMTKGVNYPCGLLKWCDQLGSLYVATVIMNLRAIYAEERYRVSPLLKRKAALGGKFYA
jgi:3-hydroxybutyryl-CoA dehydrogenase